jgi:hypothetical protein
MRDKWIVTFILNTGSTITIRVSDKSPMSRLKAKEIALSSILSQVNDISAFQVKMA